MPIDFVINEESCEPYVDVNGNWFGVKKVYHQSGWIEELHIPLEPPRIKINGRQAPRWLEEMFVKPKNKKEEKENDKN